MNVYDAIMKAADHIERNPSQFVFSSWKIPSSVDCGTPGCALGWIQTFFGGELVPGYALLPKAMGLASERDFYRRMHELCGTDRWMRDPQLAAKGLRLYARKYHAPTKRTDSQLVADLMTRVMGERIPEDA